MNCDSAYLRGSGLYHIQNTMSIKFDRQWILIQMRARHFVIQINSTPRFENFYGPIADLPAWSYEQYLESVDGWRDLKA